MNAAPKPTVGTNSLASQILRLATAPMLTEVCGAGGQWMMIGVPLPRITAAHLVGFRADDEARLLVETVGEDGTARRTSPSIRLGDLAPFLPVQIPPQPCRRRRRA